MRIIHKATGKTKDKPEWWVKRNKDNMKAHGWIVQNSPADVIKPPAKKEVAPQENSGDPFISPDWNVRDTKEALKGLGVAALKRQLDIEIENKNRKSIINEINGKLGN